MAKTRAKNPGKKKVEPETKKPDRLPSGKKVEPTKPTVEKSGASSSDPRVTFREIPTAELVVIDRMEGIEKSEVSGRFVKVAPILPLSRRAEFQADVIRNTMRLAGALGVVMAPTFVPDGARVKAPEPGAQKVSARAHVKNWIDQQAQDEGTRARVFDLVSGWMDKERL